MSRAFVKEPDGSEPEELPERPISPDRNLVTLRGLSLIEAEIAQAELALNTARQNDDKTSLAQARRDLVYWTARRKSAEPISAQPGKKVLFGLLVTLEDENGDENRFRIVGQDEADAANGLLSYTAPLARKLIGKEIGDSVEMPQGIYEITGISA